MEYWILLLIGLYSALAAAIGLNRSRSVSNGVLVAWLALAAVHVAGLLMVGTASDRATAVTGAVLCLVTAIGLYWLLLPLALLGMFFQSWLHAQRRRIMLLASAAVVGIFVVALTVPFDSLVTARDGGFILHWPYTSPGDSLLGALGIVLSSQIALWLVIAQGWKQQRMALWSEAIPLAVTALAAVVLPVIARRVPPTWQISLLALSSLPPVLALVSVVAANSRRTTRAAWLEHEIAAMSEAALVIDAQRRVVWQNAAALRWLDSSAPGAADARSLADVITHPHLRAALQQMLAERASTLECRVSEDGEDVVLSLSSKPLDRAANLPGARLIVLHDVTASRMRRNLDERSREMLAFSQVSADIASTLDVKQVVAHALRQMIAILPAEWVFIYLADPAEPDVLRLIDQISVSGVERTLPGTIGLHGSSEISQLGDYQRPLYVPDLAASPFAAHLRTFDIQSGAMIPASVSGQLTCLMFIAYPQPHAFDVVECAILESIGRQVAVAVRNARLHEQERRQRHIAETLGRVAGALSSRNLHAALKTLLGQLAGLVLFERATVLISDTPGWLRIAAHSGLERANMPGVLEEVRIEIAQFPYLRQLFEHGTPQLVANTMTDSQWRAGAHPHGSWIGVPLIVRSQVLGCFSLSHSQPGFFSQDDLQMAVTFAAQAAIAVENAQFFQREQQRRHQAEMLYQVSYNLVTSPNLDSALRAALVDLVQLCPFDRAHVGMLNGDGMTWTPRALFPPDTVLSPDVLVPINEYPLIEQICTTRKPITVPETRENLLWKTGEFAPREVRSWMGVPLVVRDRVVGVFNIDGYKPYQFTEDHQQIAQTFSLQVAGVMEMFRLLEEADRRLKHLRLVNEVGRYSAAILGVRTLIDSVAARLFSRLHYHQISVTQAEGGVLTVMAVYVDGSAVPPGPGGYPSPCVNTRKAYESAVPVWISALPPAERRRSGRPEPAASSILAVPMILADEVIGVLTVERRGSKVITQEDVDLLEPLSAQLAISVSNARLFEKVRRQAVELEGRVAERTYQIRQQQERTEAILGSVADAVIVLDLHGRVVKVNQAARQLIEQYDLDLNLGEHINALVARAQAENSAGDSDAAISLFTEEIEIGALVLQAKAARVRAGDDMLGTVIVLRDISVLKELDRMRDTFVSHVSHELRTPLANVKLYLSLLDHGRPERRADYLGVIGTEIDRLERLITDLLHLSRLRSEYHGERPQVREIIVVDQLVEQVIIANSARAEQQKKRLVYDRSSEQLPPLMGNADHLVRALTNLVSNAVNYTPEGGEIVVRSRAVQRTEHTSTEWVIIEVSDTGLGIPSDELPLIFDRFYRGSNVRMTIPGTGLGLAIIKEIVELHSGTIEVESEIGRGTTFKLALPAAPVKELEGVGE